MSSYADNLEAYVEQLEGELRTGGGATIQEVHTLAELAYEAIDGLQGDIAALKVCVPPPKGFESWEQFDKVTDLAAQSLKPFPDTANPQETV